MTEHIHLDHNEEVSEQYARYIIAVEYTGNQYYTIWGTDMTTEDEEDKVLIDAEGHFLLFKTIEAAIDYVKHQKNLFDQANFDAWVKEIKLPIAPHIHIDFDLLSDEEIDIDEEESFEELITTKNFVSDYSHQIAEDHMIDLFCEYPLANLYDLYMDTYIYEDQPAQAPAPDLVDDAIPVLNELYGIMTSKIKIM